MTFSIIGRDPTTGEIGVAVASRFFAVGTMVPHVRADRAIATQAFANPMYGVEGLRRLAAGEASAAVLGPVTAKLCDLAIWIQRQRPSNLVSAVRV